MPYIHCLECIYDQEKCSSCNQSSTYKYMYNYECLEECPIGYRIGDNNYCEACEPSIHCRYCTNNKN